ncbi:phosphatase PAP2 family protein [Streptomyces canus]|uniref:phosphatase PAP2 family protein n=1 Tax=Streptomyces canus TaxID=58343 RepID=UPI0037116C00
MRGSRGRTLLTLVIGGWGALVGLTRVYLGVHWFTDVVGGWLFALGWLGVCLRAVAWWLPEQLIPHTMDTATAREPKEGHAPQDHGRRGRSRPA